MDWIPLVGDWHWTLLVIWAPLLLLPLNFVVALSTRSLRERKRLAKDYSGPFFLRPKSRYDIPDESLYAAFVLTCLYLVTVAPVMSVVSLFATGAWGWPLAGLPLVAEIYLAGLALLLPVAVVLLAYDNENGAGLFLLFLSGGFLVTSATLLATGEVVLPLWVYIIAGTTTIPPTLLVAIGRLDARRRPLTHSGDAFSDAALMWLIVSLPLGICFALVLGTGTLLSLLAIPALAIIGAVFGGGGDGEGGLFLDLPFSITRS